MSDPFTRPVPTLAEQTARLARDVDEVGMHPERYFRPGTASAAQWVRVEPGPCTCHYPPMEHDRWEIKNPNGDGKNYLVTDEVIRTYGRRHVETKLVAKLPPLPEQAWEADR